MPKKQFNVICISIGYVESHRVASVVFTRQSLPPAGPYATEDEALDSLAKDLFEMYRAEHLQPSRRPRLRKCCKKFKGLNYCSTCGLALNNTMKFDEEEFSYWIMDTLGGTADSWGGFELENWWPWSTMREVLEHHEKEEWVHLQDDYAESKLAERAVKFVPKELLRDEDE